MTPRTPDPQPVIRRDAARNRMRILDAAQAVFTRDGLDASMASIARQADVGIATLFRHFPTKDDLTAAVLTDGLDSCTVAAEKALTNRDPWRGLTQYLTEMCALQAQDRGIADLLFAAELDNSELRTRRQRAYDAAELLLRKAQAAGAVRADITIDDIALLLVANAGVIAATRASNPASWRRMVVLITHCLQAPNA